MPGYSFSYSQPIQKTAAFQEYLDANFTAATLTAFVTAAAVQIESSVELTTEQQTELAALIAAYADPAEFLVFASKEELIGVSESTTSTNLTDVQGFIASSLTYPNGDNVRPDGSVMDQLKFILKLQVVDVSTCSDLSSGSVTVQVYNGTTDVVIQTQTFDVSEQLQHFQTLALAAGTGPAVAYKSIQLYGLRYYFHDYDCQWFLRLTSPDPRVKVRTNGLQKLFYTIQ